MLYPEPITGKSLGMPAGEIALTFDDGPGEHTYAIAKYLEDQGIKATFFVTGRNFQKNASVVSWIMNSGHQIGYHTMNHYDLPSVYQNAPWTLGRDEFRMPEGFYTGGKQVYFRAPYNHWNKHMADWLAEWYEPGPLHGPFGWDVGCDWKWWQSGTNAGGCATDYYLGIKENRGGIVLFHDNIADRRSIRDNLRTLEVLKLLIPPLLDQGYKFKRLDEVTITNPL